MLTVKNITFAYRKKTILKQVSFELDYGQSVCLLGKNGVGKSTLFKCLLHSVQPDSGQILIDGVEIQDYSRNELADRVSYIPQNPKGIFHFTVFDMILMGTASRLKNYQQPGKQENKLVEDALDRLSICHLKNKLYSEISGGEQQLVIIARSVVQQSKIIIMDEPCASLDYGNQVMVLEMIKKLSREGFLIIQATHDPNHALQYGDHVIILQEGSLAKQGKPSEIVTSELLESLYGVPIAVHFLQEQGQQICVPKRREELFHVEHVR